MARQRTFLAVEIAGPARLAAIELQRRLDAAAGPGIKWVDAANLHVTLLFLGDIDGRELVAVCQVVAAGAARVEPFGLRLTGVGAFPNSRRPKTVFAGVTDGATELATLYATLSPPLAELGVTRQEDRAYTPHLTLGRVSSEADGEKLAAELPRHATWTGGQTAVSEVVVFTSELARSGPQYTAVARAPLGA